MPKPPATSRPLADDEIDIIRLVARCLTNREIAAQLGIRVERFREQLDKIHARIGTSTRHAEVSSAVTARMRMVAWAYEHGLMNDDPAGPIELDEPPAPLPDFEPATGPHQLSGPLVESVVAVCEAIYRDRPRGDLRKLATEVLQDAGRLPRPNQRRAKPAA